MPNGSIDPSLDYVQLVLTAQNLNCPTIVAAGRDAAEVRQLLSKSLRQFTSDDVDIVVFGSLARGEWTHGSDVDWTMLIDGQAKTDHRATARAVEKALADIRFRGHSLKEPGGEGIFGNMAFSHDIVHHIGGQSDTNRNTTQRVLMLLEATALRDQDDELSGPFARISRQILNRYLHSDSIFHDEGEDQSRIPRFLLNDIVRYWRTMCVDFAYKDWEQAGKKWAIRNIKLRTSRKLLFFAGFLTVFSCFQNESLRRGGLGSFDYLLKLQSHLLNFVRATPLNILAWTLRELSAIELCAEFLTNYESFLVEINDINVRKHLGDLCERDVYKDEDFLRCRKISHSLQATLQRLCFAFDTPLRQFTCEYGLF